MGSFGGLEWIVIGLAVLLLFGAKRIPELARGLGQGIKEFRKASDDIKREIEEGHQPEPAPRKESKAQESKPKESPAPESTDSVKSEDNHPA
ncbi:MAG: Sec-independent protein translocase subunit TatA/TatB [Bacteroidota bacterium]